MRPRVLADVVGQDHLLAPGKLLHAAVVRGRVPSLVLWGPPGSGKTTLAKLLAQHVEAAFETLSATSAGVKELREAIERARRRRSFDGRETVLFIDEIHRFHRGQQDALLPHVESGAVTLIGATTENPSFEVNAALLSRTRVARLRELGIEELVTLLGRALSDRERGLGARELVVEDDLLRAIAAFAQGDARAALGTLEIASDLVVEPGRSLDRATVEEALGERVLRHDRTGDGHFDVASALIKSMRASDPDAAVYWLVRMIDAGEDPTFIARRLVIFASEDVGNADPRALMLAQSAADAVAFIGMPEGGFALCQAAIFLSMAPKSNTTLRALAAVREDVREHGALSVPPFLRNAPTALAKSEGHGAGYAYPHDFADGLAPVQPSCLPLELSGRSYVDPSPRGWEAEAFARLATLRERLRGRSR